jgi:bacteriocin biosynthesis cyclodehydratase domain-containing protein
VPCEPVDDRRRGQAGSGRLWRVQTTAPSPTHSLRPRRLGLRPGVHVLRRDAEHLQVGLDPVRAVVLPDTDAVRALLGALTDPAARVGEHEYDGPTLAVLAESGLLVDTDTLLPLVPAAPAADRPAPAPGPPRAGVAALAAQDGDAAGALLAARGRMQVEVLTTGSAEAPVVTSSLTALLSLSGVPHRTAAGPAAVPETDPPTCAPTTGLLVAVGEPARELLDPWVRAGVPHLLLRLVEGHAVVGPFVLPGETACLRCVDAHHTDVDPAWPLLVAQYATAVERPRQDTVPEPVDPVLAALATAWAARELVSHAEGRRPPTASTTVRLDPHLTAVETHCWPRHPACGCTWADDLAASATMEA